jgi:PIN domain nuclease of toxin-antitoxin system
LALVLDTSALLAYLRDEPGAELVAKAIADGVIISTVNLAEVFSRSADRGADPAKIANTLTQSGLLEGAITIEPFTTADAIDTARLRPLTRDAGLSLGDRACLALARRLGTTALTADTAWQGVAHDVELHTIR